MGNISVRIDLTLPIVQGELPAFPTVDIHQNKFESSQRWELGEWANDFVTFLRENTPAEFCDMIRQGLLEKYNG